MAINLSFFSTHGCFGVLFACRLTYFCWGLSIQSSSVGGSQFLLELFGEGGKHIRINLKSGQEEDRNQIFKSPPSIITALKWRKRTCEKFGSSRTIPGLSGWFGIWRTKVPAGGGHRAGAEVGGGETGRLLAGWGWGRRAEGCGLGDRRLFCFPSQLVHDCTTCSLSSAGRASNTERST